MPTFEPGLGREKLRFAEEVQWNIEFLTTEYDFRCVETKVTFVRYESESVFVNVYHGRGSYEIGVEIGLLSDESGHGYGLQDILRSLNVPGLQGYAATTADEVRRRVASIAELVRKHCTGMLHGDPADIARVRKAVSEWSDAYMREMHLSRTREQADRAWHAKDYATVVRAYESMLRTEMTPSEVKKLEYARKRLRQDDH